MEVTEGVELRWAAYRGEQCLSLSASLGQAADRMRMRSTDPADQAGKRFVGAAVGMWIAVSAVPELHSAAFVADMVMERVL